MPRDFRPQNVRKTASMLMNANIFTQQAKGVSQKNINAHEPTWYNAISDYPPPASSVRTLPVQHKYQWRGDSFSKPESSSSSSSNNPTHPKNPSRRTRRPGKPSRMFAPNTITYEEDALRTTFFQDHPWELARPRQILEDDGKDYQRWDWNKAHQPGRSISGESVIQRQLRLQRLQSNSKDSAYDQARKEHYALRHEEEMEARIAREEALAVGARFGRTSTDIGMQLENKQFDEWKTWAEAQVLALEQTRSAAYTAGGQGGGEEGGAAEATLEDTIDRLGTGNKDGE